MKKWLLIIVLSSLMLPHAVSISFADQHGNAASAPNVVTATPQEQTEAQRLSSLQAQQTQLQTQQEADKKALEALKDDNSITSIGPKAALGATIAGREAQLTALTEQIKVQKVKANYENLINSNTAKGKEIDQQIKDCSDCTEREKEILALRKEANIAYGDYLVDKRDLEECKATPGCADNEPTMNQLQEFLETSQNTLTEKLRKITQLETELNRRATFDVSDIFSTENDDPTFDEVDPVSFQSVVNTIANWMITLVASLAVTTMIIGGFLMIISGGDESRLETGKTIFTYSLIGVFVTLTAFGIISFIQSLFY